MTEEFRDSILIGLTEAVEPTIEKIDNDLSYATLVIGAKSMTDPDSGQEGVLTVLSASGLYTLLEEGIYAELADQIESGNFDLFATFRNIVRELEKDFNISTEEEDDKPAYIH